MSGDTKQSYTLFVKVLTTLPTENNFDINLHLSDFKFVIYFKPFSHENSRPFRSWLYYIVKMYQKSSIVASIIRQS